MAAVPKLISSGLNPTIVEYIDNVVMAAIVNAEKLELGIPEEIRETCAAYLVVALENNHTDRLDEDATALGALLSDWGGLGCLCTARQFSAQLIVARENVFWTAKAIGADDIIDVVVPRASMPEFLRKARDIAMAEGVGMSGCGHAGDGNVHGVLFCKDPKTRKKLLTEIFAVGMSLGGAISGEHGVGRAKADYFCELEDPAKLGVDAAIKHSFDPAGILNPGVVFAPQRP